MLFNNNSLNSASYYILTIILHNNDNNIYGSYPYKAGLYAWFGFKYGLARMYRCDMGYGCSVALPDNGLILDRFWTKKDNFKY